MIELRKVTENNYVECMNLKVTVEDDSFVDSVSYSLAEAYVFYNESRVFAIYNNETLVGFVSMYIGENNFQIINFFIADTYQNCGFGTKAAKLCINYLLKEYNASRISVPVNVRHKLAQHFWLKLGFNFSDSLEDGYVFMRLESK